MFHYYETFPYLCSMKRKVIAFGRYYAEFIASLTDKEVLKVKYILSLLETEDRLPTKFIKLIRDGVYEIRINYNNNIYRIFFIFDEGKIVVLFNGFQKKTQKTPSSEIEKAIKIKEEYYEYKRQHAD
ncbi:phage-related protein [Parabacteroides sp. PF5-9]|nr:phage-related protein [Parabacteroides sp. PF5-9]